MRSFVRSSCNLANRTQAHSARTTDSSFTLIVDLMPKLLTPTMAADILSCAVALRTITAPQNQKVVTADLKSTQLLLLALYGSIPASSTTGQVSQQTRNI